MTLWRVIFVEMLGFPPLLFLDLEILTSLYRTRKFHSFYRSEELFWMQDDWKYRHDYYMCIFYLFFYHAL